jgi:hypothetical protein
MEDYPEIIEPSRFSFLKNKILRGGNVSERE